MSNSHLYVTSNADFNPQMMMCTLPRLGLYLYLRSSNHQQILRSSRRLLFGFLICCIPIALFGQMRFSTYETCSVNQGLVGNNVQDIVQDPQGFIWVATLSGVSRYDGYHYINFNHASHSKFFKDNAVHQLVLRGHRLLLLSATSGCLEINTQTLRLKRTWRKGVTSYDYSNDTTVILFSDNTLLLQRQNKFIKRNFKQTSAGSVMLQGGKLYLCFRDEVPQRLSLMSLKTIHQFKKAEPMKMNGRLIKSRKSVPIYHSGAKIFQVLGNTIKPHPQLQFKDKAITYYREGPKGEPLIVLNNKVPFVLRNETFLTGSYLDKNYNAEAKCILKLDDFVTFVGSNQGFFQLMERPKLVRQIQDIDLFSQDDIRIRRSILPIANDQYLLTGFPQSVQLNGDQLTLKTTDPAISVYDAYWQNDTLYMATDGSGFWINTNNHPIQQLMPPFSNIDILYHISSHSKDLLLIAGRKRLVLFDKRHQLVRASLPQTELTFYKLTPFHAKNRYLAATDRGIYIVTISPTGFHLRLLNPKFRKEAKDVLCHRRTGDIWVATNKGLVVLSAHGYGIKKTYAKANEITNPIVTALLQDDQNRVWASTFSGVSVYGKTIFHLTNKNGIKNIEFNYKSALRLPSGEIMFGGLNCYDIFEPNWLEEQLFTRDFVVSGYERISNHRESQFTPKNASHLNLVEFNTADEELVIYFSNKDYTNGKLYHFFYQIDDNSWIEMKDSRSLHLSSLSAGQHVVHVKMLSPFGQELARKKFEIEAKLPFYKQPEFILLILALLLITALLALYFVRQNLKIEMDTKSRIAMDLHDEAGTILTRALLYANRKNYQIETIQSSLQEALHSIRAFMDSLSRKSFDLNELQDDIREFFQKTSENKQVTQHIQIDIKQNRSISAELYRDIKLCIFEMATNSMKHAEAKNIWFKMNTKGDSLFLIFEDDGIFDQDRGLDYKGHGLHNLEKRTKRNKGNIHFSQRDPNGLNISMEFLL